MRTTLISRTIIAEQSPALRVCVADCYGCRGRPDGGGAMFEGQGEIDAVRDHRRSLGHHLIAARHSVRAWGDARRPFRLISGWIAQCHDDRHGDRRVIGILLPGEAWRGGTPFGMTALSDAEIEYLDAPAVAEIDRDGRWSVGGVDDLAAVQEWLIAFTELPAEGRIAFMLHHLFSRLERIGLVDRGWAHIPLTQIDIGTICSLTAVHVNRVLRRMKDDHLFTVDDERRWHVLDRTRLMRLAGVRPSDRETMGLPRA